MFIPLHRPPAAILPAQLLATPVLHAAPSGATGKAPAASAAPAEPKQEVSESERQAQVGGSPRCWARGACIAPARPAHKRQAPAAAAAAGA